MSGTTPNDTKGNNRSYRGRRTSSRNQPQTTRANAEQPRQETSFSYNEDFSSSHTATSRIHEPQIVPQNGFYSQPVPQRPIHTYQSLMPSTQLSSQVEITDKPNARQTFPATMSKYPVPTQSYITPGSNPKPATTVGLSQAVPMQSNMIMDKSSSSTPSRPLSAHEDQINRILCEIILTIHESKEFVSRERVQQELFNHCKVKSWSELGVQPGRFNVLINLTDRQKNVSFYMHVFEQIFNLCTLNDLESYLVKFMKVNRYEDLRLGPLDKNPEIQRVFGYKPTNSNQVIPRITTGDVIKRFMEFQRKHRHQKLIPVEEFPDELVRIYGLQSREELGVFCKSSPFLIQVINNVRRDQDLYIQQVKEEAEQQIIAEAQARVNELKDEMRDAQGLSTFNNKKTPTAVFNYLTSIIDKYLDIIPQQPVLYAILVQLREDELLQCLFNMSIYLGTIDTPDVFIAELKQLYNHHAGNPQTQELMTMQQSSILAGPMSKKDRRKINAMIQKQQVQSQTQASNIELDGQNTTISTPINTSFASSLSTSHPSKPKPPVSLKQLCSDIYTALIRYDTILTIEQLLEIDEDLCTQHGVASFSAFTYDQNDHDNNPVNFVSFLDKHRQIIDPHGELSVYEHTASIGDQIDLYSFIQQLSAINNEELNEGHQHAHTEQFHLSTEKLSAVEKSVQHKFGGTISSRKLNQLIKKVKQRSRKNKASIIRFEESLLDVNGLNRLNICPTSLNVDETQLCQLILRCPLMTDLHTWLQWSHFFQPKYGTLKTFLTKHDHKFKNLRLLETSNHELFRLPINTALATFEDELNSMRIRSAVGHLCALIMQEGLVKRFSFNVYRTSMDTWFRYLRSLNTLQNDHIDPMQCILDFLMYLPVLIGQSRLIEELVLHPLDDVFGNDRENKINSRTRIWNLANPKQKTKLELWGHTVDIKEWKNENKWLGCEDSEEKFLIKLEKEFEQKQSLDTVNPVVPITTATEPQPISTSIVTSDTPILTSAPLIDHENESVQAAFDHIQSLRRGFGVDSDLDSNGQKVVNNYQGMLERSLEKISTDLFSNQGHFVLELIQNADDNQYTTNHLPTLRFILSSERILVCNNEIGFQPNHVGAICNVGSSTKGKHKQGYAGHKGIGFKSVFMISYRPEIHSRDYHFRFDTVDGKEQIGYIRPIWIDQYEEVLPNSEEWTTCIRLPIKTETRHDLLQRNFDDIQARLLLFLNRLRQIEIINQEDISSMNNNNHRIFTRIDHSQGQIIELQEKTLDKPLINNFWLVIKKVIEVPNDIKMKLRDVKGDVDSTTIAIAYPLSGIQESSTQLPPIQHLFAYLPLRSYGFRFILQADFEIPATRQEIRHDNLWNDWLKSEMPCLLDLAYHQFQRLPDLLASSSINTKINTHLTPIQTIKYFLKLLPSRNELDPYFNTFVEKSIQLLMGVIKFPVSRQNEKEETIIDWVLPSQCFIVQDPFIRKILSQDLLFSHFNCYYIHEQLAQECDEQILLDLGCRLLDFADITQLIEASYKQDEQEHVKTMATIEQIAQWLVCLDYSLQQQRDQLPYNNIHNETQEKETISKLKQMKIIPLKDQSRLVSVSDFEKHGITFPLNKSIAYSTHFRIVLDDIPRLDEQLLDFIEDKYPRRVDSIKKLLRKIGINESPNFREIYRQHILPIMSDPNRWLLKSESVLISYLLCIYEYLYLPDPEQFENELKQLQNKMVIKTRDNKFVSLGSPDIIVHLTSTYGSQLSLESLKLAKYKFTFISDDYYLRCPPAILHSKSNMPDLVTFLEQLKISDFLQVDSINESFLQVSQLADTKWTYLTRSLSEMIHDAFTIQDYRCEEFNKLVSPPDDSQTADPNLCIQLLRYLDKHHAHVSGYYAASIILARAHKFGHGPIKAVESSFCLSLRQHAWIPVIGDRLYKPGDVYLIQQNNETSAFRRYVPHLDVSKLSLCTEDFIYNILGIKSQVTHRTMFELLMKWSCNLDSESLWNLVKEANTSDIIPCTLPTTFRQTCLDTIDNFRRIYHFLTSNNDTRMLLSRFRLWPLVFIPRDQQTGDFLFVHQTFWNDPISLLSSQDNTTDSQGRISILVYYGNNPTLEQFFVEILHIELQPTTDDYLPLLSTVQDINKIWLIIEIITKLAMEQNKQQEVREKYGGIAFIPCLDNKQKLVKYTDHPFYPHNTDIANLFADTLPIIKLPDRNISVEFKEQFCLLFNIENLGKVIQTKINVENEQPSTSLADFYRSSIDLIQHFLLSKNLISDTQSHHLSAIFSRMQFVCVNRIDISYCYGTDLIKVPLSSYNTDTYIDEESCKFYILKKFESSEMRYTDAMVNFIAENQVIRSELLSYIKKLLQIYQKDDVHGLANLRESLMENYEPKWTIPEEVKIVAPVVEPSVKENEQPISKKPQISEEDVRAMMREPSLRPPPRPKEVTNEKDGNGSTSFPVTAGVVESDVVRKNYPPKPKSDDTLEREHTLSSSSQNNQNHRVPQDHEQQNHEHVVPENKTNKDTDVNTAKRKSNEDQINRPHAPLVFTDPISLPSPSFEQIIVSSLTNFDPFPSHSSTDESVATNLFPPISSEADLITGRQGEELVFRFLQWKYPNEIIEWFNQNGESGRAYDIRRIIKTENNREELIEVKTTRSFDQNTFPISIGEVEYLLEYPTNYFIYRVYYADQKDLSTITVINKIKDNLQLKHFKLSMTVVSKPNN